VAARSGLDGRVRVHPCSFGILPPANSGIEDSEFGCFRHQVRTHQCNAFLRNSLAIRTRITESDRTGGQNCQAGGTNATSTPVRQSAGVRPNVPATVADETGGRGKEHSAKHRSTSILKSCRTPCSRYVTGFGADFSQCPATTHHSM